MIVLFIFSTWNIIANTFHPNSVTCQIPTNHAVSSPWSYNSYQPWKIKAKGRSKGNWVQNISLPFIYQKSVSSTKFHDKSLLMNYLQSSKYNSNIALR